MPSGNAVIYSSGYQGGRAFVTVVGANGGINVSSNSTGGGSDLSNPAANDVIAGGTIASVWWSTTTYVKIFRGSNVVLTFAGPGTGFIGRDQGWPGCNLYFAATCNVIVGDANTTVYVELSKEYSGGTD